MSRWHAPSPTSTVRSPLSPVPESAVRTRGGRGVVLGVLHPLVPLELGPPFHGDHAAVKFTLMFNGLVLLLLICLSSLAPGEVIKLPESVGR